MTNCISDVRQRPLLYHRHLSKCTGIDTTAPPPPDRGSHRARAEDSDRLGKIPAQVQNGALRSMSDGGEIKSTEQGIN
jgi:hypothetical protein